MSAPVSRLLYLLILAALLIAPAGRMAQAAAPAATGDAHMTMPGHCPPAAPTPDRDEDRSIDCVIACAAAPAADAGSLPVFVAVAAPPVAAAVRPIDGLHHAAEPPPPRLG